MAGSWGVPRLGLHSKVSRPSPAFNVGPNHDQLGADPVHQRVQRLLAGHGKMQDIGALPHLAAKALAKNFSDIGPVVAYTRGPQEAATRQWLRDAHPHRILPEIGLRGSPVQLAGNVPSSPLPSLAVLILRSAEDRLMTGVTNSRHA